MCKKYAEHTLPALKSIEFHWKYKHFRFLQLFMHSQNIHIHAIIHLLMSFKGTLLTFLSMHFNFIIHFLIVSQSLRFASSSHLSTCSFNCLCSLSSALLFSFSNHFFQSFFLLVCIVHHVISINPTFIVKFYTSIC